MMRLHKILLSLLIGAFVPRLAAADLDFWSRGALDDAQARVREAQWAVASAQSYSDDIHWRLRSLPDEIRTQQQAMAQLARDIGQVQGTITALEKQLDTAQGGVQQQKQQIGGVTNDLAAASANFDRLRAEARTAFESSTVVIDAKASLAVAEQLLSNSSALALKSLAASPAYQDCMAGMLEAKGRLILLRTWSDRDATSIAKAAQDSWNATAKLKEVEQAALDADVAVRDAREKVVQASRNERLLREKFETQLPGLPHIAPVATAVKSLQRSQAELTRQIATIEAAVSRLADEHGKQSKWLAGAGTAMSAAQSRLDALTNDYQAAQANVRNADWSLAAAADELIQAQRCRDDALLTYNRHVIGGGQHGGGGGVAPPQAPPESPTVADGNAPPVTTPPVQVNSWGLESRPITQIGRRDRGRQDARTPRVQDAETRTQFLGDVPDLGRQEALLAQSRRDALVRVQEQAERGREQVQPARDQQRQENQRQQEQQRQAQVREQQVIQQQQQAPAHEARQQAQQQEQQQEQQRSSRRR